MNFKKILSTFMVATLSFTLSFYGVPTSAVSSSFVDIVSKIDTAETFKTKDLTYTWSEDATHINLKDYATSIQGSGAVVDENTITISQEGTYVVSGSLTDGQLVINDVNKTKIQVVLNGASITSSTASPICVLSADKVYLTLASGTVNTLSDSGTKTNGEYDAAIYAADDITINGTGTLNVIGNYKMGIHSKNDVKVCGAVLNVDTSASVNLGHAISGKDLVAIKDATVELKAGNDGIQSDNAEEADKGNVIIENSDITVNSRGDGIQAENAMQLEGGNFDITTTLDGDGLKAGESLYIYGEPTVKINSVADGIKTKFEYVDTEKGNIQILNGHFTITAADDGIQASSETVDAVEKNASLLVLGGEFDITSVGDGIKATKQIQIADGTFKITSSQDAIQSENANDTTVGTISIENGTFNLTSACDGIQANTALNIYGGNFTIKTTGVASSNSCKGLKATGSLVLSGGSFSITSTDDGVHSNNSIVIDNCDALNISSSDDGIHADSSVTINGGNINITKSYEGVEGAVITINGGNTKITASDDGVNATDGTGSTMGGGGTRPFADVSTYASANISLNINGGYTTVNASGDGLDSNGTIEVTGGTTIVYGPNSGGNGSFDYDGTATVTGGTLIAIGTSDMAQNFGTASTQCSIMLKLNSSRTANTTFALFDSSDNSILAITAKKTTSCILVTSPEIKTGNAYTFKTGGTVVNGNDGFATGADCYNGGSIICTTTPTSNVWNINESGASTGGNMDGGTFPSGGGGTRPTKPSRQPSTSPTPAITATPTVVPTTTSTVTPNVKPTLSASPVLPTVTPTVKPTLSASPALPTITPTATPTVNPTYSASPDLPTETPRVTVTPTQTEVPSSAVITVKEESNYTVDRENLALTDIPQKTQVNEFKENIVENVVVCDENGKVVGDDATVKTGYIVRLTDEKGTVIDELTICILGDINCDGQVNSRDIATLQRNLLQASELSTYVKLAADMSVDNKINSRDLSALQRKIINFQ